MREYVMERRCIQCNVLKDIMFFQSGYNSGKIYYYKKCKSCDRLRVLAKQQRYKNKYRKELAEKQKEYYEAHKSDYKNYNCKYYIENKDKIKRNSKRYLYNRRKNDLSFLLKDLFSARIRRLMKKDDKPIKEILPYSIEELRCHLESKFEYWMNWQNWGKYDKQSWNDADPSTWKWNIDHVIPQSKFMISSIYDENFKKCWSLENLRPLSAKQNVLEGARR